MRRPTFSQYGLGGDAGLSTVLTGATPVERALVRVHAKDLSRVPEGASPDGPSFYVLPCGPIPPNPQGLLSRQSMSRLLKQLNEAADVVLVDVPPIGTVNDPVTLARLVDGIALVVRLNRTTKEAARRTMRTLENLETPVLGVVVTDAPISADGYYAYRPAGVEGSAEAEAPDAAPSARAPS
jgi:Mrp family chromosome partitioning ATPase